MNFIDNLKKITKSDVLTAGGKGASLGELIKIGMPVPAGFVLLTTAFEYFLKKNGLKKKIEETLSKAVINNASHTSILITGWIEKSELPEDLISAIEKNFKTLDTKYVSVRSSAANEDSKDAAWAGQLETYLNTDSKNLIKNIKRCWASLFSHRAIVYGLKKNINRKNISIAVVIQKMVDSEVAGVAFSINPVTHNPNQIVIEAGYGFGESVVSGKIKPDRYFVDKKTKKIISDNDKNNLSKKQIYILTELLAEIENKSGFSCDIEWAFAKNKIYILQNRPITGKYEPVKKQNIFDNIWVKRWAGSYTFTSCDYWGRQYYFSLKKYLGVGFHDCLFVHKKGTVSFYLPKSEYLNFGRKMSGIAVKHPAKAKKWLISLKDNTDKIIPLINKKVNRLPTANEYLEFLHYFDKHLPLHNFMKKTVDFLPEKEGVALMPFFKEARIYSEDVYSLSEKFFRGFAKIIAKNSGYNPKNLTCLTQNEIENYLKTKKLPNEKDLIKRFKCSALLFSKGKPELIFGIKVNSIENQILKTLLTNKHEIKGSVAYPGIVIGTARIVIDPFHPGNFKKGDILVTGMTRPEFLPLSEKAAAIITDAGGILCHAAITARELKKPCIVGTEIATKLIKDGQTIKVDAKNGLISVIK